MSTLKHPDDLQDKDILMNLSAHRGAGVQWDTFVLNKQMGEIPIRFIERVKGEYRAWYNSQEAQKASQARAAQASNRKENVGPPPSSTPPRGDVQGPEASLEATIKAQIARLDEQASRFADECLSYGQLADEAQWKLRRCTKELAHARRFLKELEEGDKPQVPQAVGADLHSEMGPRKPKRRARMGAASNPQDGGVGSKGRGEEDKGGSGEPEVSYSSEVSIT